MATVKKGTLTKTPAYSAWWKHLRELVIETAARAIYEARNGRGCKAWSLLPGSHKEPYLADAKAAIDAYHDYIRRHS